ncbi:TPA: hypothetical protein ACSTL5_004861 [Serratia fonticola]
MFFGIFIFIAGVLSLLENTGFITSNVKWGLPLAVTCIGMSLIYDAISAKKAKRSVEEEKKLQP